MLSEPQQAQESEWTNRYLEGTVEIQLRIGYVHELFCAGPSCTITVESRPGETAVRREVVGRNDL